jgi:hypothetical protein
MGSMSRNALLGGVAVATVVAGGIMAGGSAGATSTTQAQAHPHTHTIRLTATRLSLANTSKSTFVEANTVFKAGKKVGYETQSCNDGGTNVVCAVTFSLPRGVLLGHFTVPITTSDKSKTTGKITGGLATYSGDHGTIHASFNGSHAKYRLTYHS